MTPSRISEFERWPQTARKPATYVLLLLAELYGTSTANLLDLADLTALAPRERMMLVGSPPAPAAPATPTTIVLTEAAHGESSLGTSRRRSEVAADEGSRQLLGGVPLVDQAKPARLAEDAVRGSVALLAEVVASEIDPLTVEDIEERVDGLATGYFRTDPDTFRRTLLQLRVRVVDLLAARSALRHRRRLYAALATLTGMLAESSFAIGAPTDEHCAAAVVLAEEAGHTALVGWVRGTQAQIALHTGGTAAAVRYARAGETAPRGSAAAVRSAAYVARASARLGDRSAAFAAWRSAERAWDQLDTALTDSVFSLSADYLPYCELTMLAWLGEVAPAMRLVDRDHASGSPTVGRAIGQIDSALVRVLAGDVEEAVRLGNGAIDIGESRMTTPLQDRFGDLVSALAPSDIPVVHDLRRRCVWISS